MLVPDTLRRPPSASSRPERVRCTSTSSSTSCPTSTRPRPRTGSTSLDQVVGDEGENRARFLMFKLLKRARQLHVGLPPLTQTRYINTISPEQEPFFPGDEEHRAPDPADRPLERGGDGPPGEQPKYAGIGGHLATYASAASLYEVGLQPLLPGQGRRPGRPDLLPGPRGARHVRPGLPRGPPDRGPARPLPARGRRRRRACRRTRIRGSCPTSGSSRR